MAGTWRRRGLLLAAVLAGGIGAWLALRGGAAGSPDASTPEGRSAPLHPSTGPVLQGTASAPATRTGRGAITGRVTQDGRPVAAEVEVLWRAEVAASELRSQATTPGVLARFDLPPPPEALATLRTDAEGRFEVTGLARGAYEVRALTIAGARGRAGVLVPLDGARRHLEIAVAAGSGVLRGRIQHADGSAYRGKAFVATPVGEDAPWPISLGTPLALDAQGNFDERGLPLGLVRVQAVDPGGWCVRGPHVTLPTSGPYVLTLGAEPGCVGRVVARDDGAPISGAIVIGSAYPTGGAFVLLHTSTDAEGRWRLALPAGGLYALRAQAPGFAMVRLDGEEIPGGSRPIELRLAREAVLAGRVIAATDGRPAPGVTVRVLPGHYRADYFAPPPTLSDAQGRYEVRGLPPGSATVLAEGAGWAPARLVSGWRALAPDGTSVDLVGGRVTTRYLEVEPAGRLRGRVLDAQGTPLKGAVVWAEGRRGPASYSSSGAQENLAPPSVTTDDQGTFVVEGLAPSAAHVLLARSPEGQEAHSGLVRVGPEPQEPVEIRFVALRTVEVRVEDAETGAPVASAYLDSTSGEETGAPIVHSRMTSWSTELDGTARITLPVGVPRTFDVRAGGYGVAEGVRVEAEQANLLVRLRRLPGITGQVRHADGRPASAEVHAFERGEKGWTERDWIGTHTDGTFRLDADGTIPLRLRASAADIDGVHVGEATTTPGGPHVVITLRPIADAPPGPDVLRVRVLDPAGAPVPHANLEFTSRGGRSTEVTNGWAEVLAPAWAGETIVVSRARDEDDMALPVGPGRLGPLDAARPEVELRLPAEFVIEGVVRTADGSGVRGACLSPQAREREGGAGFLWLPDAWSDSEGRFRLGSLGPGAYDLDVKTRSHGLLKLRDVAAGRRDLVITLDDGSAAAITVVDDEGLPVVGADVRARNHDESRAQEAQTDARGIARLMGLPKEEELQLLVTFDGAASVAQRSATIEGWRPADTTVRLPALNVVRGRVVDSTGRPVPGVAVHVSAGASTYPTETDAQGRFRFAVERAGQPTVEILDGDEVLVEAPFLGEELVLVHDPGLELTVHVEGWAGSAPEGRAASLLSDRTPSHRRDADVGADGVALFKHLKPNTGYTLWIPPRGDGRSLLLRDVRPAAGTLRVALREGRSIRGQVRMAPGTELFSLEAQLEGVEGVEVDGTLQPDGTYEILGLPEGRWKLTLYAESSDTIITREAIVGAGGTHDIDLTKPR